MMPKLTLCHGTRAYITAYAPRPAIISRKNRPPREARNSTKFSKAVVSAILS